MPMSHSAVMISATVISLPDTNGVPVSSTFARGLDECSSPKWAGSALVTQMQIANHGPEAAADATQNPRVATDAVAEERAREGAQPDRHVVPLAWLAVRLV